MATTTTNLGLTKPATSDNVDITVINGNMDIIDAKVGAVGSTPLQTQATNSASSISALQNNLAIICNGDTHTAIASGQYAYVRNHSTLAEGLYKATAAIAANGTLSSSNLSAASGGGLNNLRNTIFYREQIVCTPANDLAEGAYGYFTVPVTYARGKNIIAVSIALSHPATAAGYSLNGGYINTNNVMYIGYYTPHAIPASYADFEVYIVYTDAPMSTNRHDETL